MRIFWCAADGQYGRRGSVSSISQYSSAVAQNDTSTASIPGEVAVPVVVNGGMPFMTFCRFVSVVVAEQREAVDGPEMTRVVPP